jgi:hypothetical protein
MNHAADVSAALVAEAAEGSEGRYVQCARGDSHRQADIPRGVQALAVFDPGKRLVLMA